MQLELDFLQFQPMLRLSRSGSAQWVFDPVRHKKVVLTPEELLRQLVVLYLLEYKQYPRQRMRVEMGLTVNGLAKRSDIVVFDHAMAPWLIVECKSPKVPLTQATFEQAARYNIPLQAPYLAITNGLSTFCCAIRHSEGAFEFLSDFPEWI